jgi:hypothetical protein
MRDIIVDKRWRRRKKSEERVPKGAGREGEENVR